ncbi:MAG: methyl-accepting chemotaxis protein [Bryobacteraceae bacterium]
MAENHLTVGKKITFACSLLVLLTLVLGSVSLIKTVRTQDALQGIAGDFFPGVYQIGKLAETAMDLHSLVLMHIPAAAQEKAGFDRKIADRIQKIQQEEQGYEKTIETARNRELYARIPLTLDKYLAAKDQVLALSRAGKAAEASALTISTTRPAFNELIQAIDDEVDFNKSNGDANLAFTQAALANANTWSWMLLVISVVTGLALAFILVRGINGTLRRVTLELARGAVQIASAASEVASSSQSLAQGASEQAASLEETSASSEEITSMTRKSAESSSMAASEMAAVDRNVGKGNQTLEQMVASMAEINNSSNKISKIIKVIDEIAFQTNILALNAAVEAARAGEAGMGFAVVAEEVRNLAQRSAKAAKDTAALIEESIATSGEGTKRLEEVSQAFRSITGSAGRVKMLVDEVNLGSQEQARGMEQIARAISQMDEVTQRTAANAEESASASEQMAAQAQALNDIVCELESLVGGVEDNLAAPRQVLNHRQPAAAPARRRV